MPKRLVITVLFAGILFGGLAGCKDDAEQQRSVVIVSSINCGAPPVVDVYEQGDTIWAGGGGYYTADDFYSEDWIQVFFWNRPYNDMVSTGPGEPYGDFRLTRYTIEWARTDGGPVLPSRTEGMSLWVPSGEIAGSTIRLMSLQEKLTPLITSLQYGLNQGFVMIAHITFYGRETGSDRETKVVVDLAVEVDDFIVKTSEKEDITCNS